MTLLGRALLCLLLPSLGAGCFSGDGMGVPDAGRFVPPPPHDQFVLDTFRLPTTPTEAQQFGLDLDGDPQGRPDNAFGQIFSTLASQADLDMGESIESAILRGRIIVLLDLETSGLTTAPDVLAHVLIGDMPTPAACTDPDILATCGRHLAGDASFDIHPESPEDAALVGNITGGQLSLGPDPEHPVAYRGAVSIRLDISDAVAPIMFNLIGTRLTATVNPTNGTVTEGALGGALTEEELNTNVLPGIVSLMAEMIAEDCTGSPPDCCDPESAGETSVELFDDCSEGSLSCDCRVTLEELQQSDLISSLLSPDLDLLDADGNFNPREDEVKDSLSLGSGFTAIGADFELP